MFDCAFDCAKWNVLCLTVIYDFAHRSPGVASLVLGEAGKEASNAWWCWKVVCEVCCVKWNTWVVSVWLHADIFCVASLVLPRVLTCFLFVRKPSHWVMLCISYRCVRIGVLWKKFGYGELGILTYVWLKKIYFIQIDEQVMLWKHTMIVLIIILYLLRSHWCLNSHNWLYYLLIISWCSVLLYVYRTHTSRKSRLPCAIQV